MVSSLNIIFYLFIIFLFVLHSPPISVFWIWSLYKKKVQILELLFTQFSAPSCYFPPLKSTHSPRHFSLEHPQSMFFPQRGKPMEGSCFCHYEINRLELYHIMEYTAIVGSTVFMTMILTNVVITAKFSRYYVQNYLYYEKYKMALCRSEAVLSIRCCRKYTDL